MQPIGIRPTNDFAFKKTFGSPENKVALISLLNAILTLPVPIVDVTIENPYNLQDFQNDKLSILDIRAVDQRGAIYDVEMQLSTHSGLVKRIVFYGCEVYAGQLKARLFQAQAGLFDLFAAGSTLGRFPQGASCVSPGGSGFGAFARGNFRNSHA